MSGMGAQRGGPDPPVAISPQGAGSPFSPFRHATFAVLWTATGVATIGTWMYNTASGWLMTSLDGDPLTVSLVQVATSLPLFLFALPAGALADIVDKRRFLIASEGVITAVYAMFAALVWFGLVTPGILLLFTFLIAVGGALAAPTWQSIVPQLVPKADLPPAVAATSAAINVSRAVGPALGGVIAAAFGIAAPFCLDALGNLGITGALLWWRCPPQGVPHLPAERFVSAIRAGVRYARNDPNLRATLMRGVAFFLFASAYWALLPLIARSQIAGGPDHYGMLLGAIGVGAVGAAIALPSLIKKLGPDRLVSAGTLGTAIALVIFGVARNVMTALTASLIAGVAWIAVLSSLTVCAQVALPQWVRGRGLAMLVAVTYGAMTLGSAVWGKLAAMAGLPIAHFVAAAGALVAIPLMWRWKLQPDIGFDPTPSMHWPAPIATRDVEYDRGPVLVTVEYRIDPRNRGPFLAAIGRLAHERRRDGAYAWGVFEDAAAEGRYLETFLTASWLEHLRQHERVTIADRALQDAAQKYHLEGTPKVTHLIAADPRERDARRQKPA
jgi:MFS family permease